MLTKKNELFDFMSNYISKCDIYAAKNIAKVSAYICKKRNELKMTQKEFAKMMNVSQGMISKWESANYNFTIETISYIAEKLNATFDIEFMPESEYMATAKNDYINTSDNSNINRLSFDEYNGLAA